MIKDAKYIIKRILIGVGIILVLSFIRGNKVKALENVQVSWLNSPYSVISSDSSYQLLAQSGSQRIFRNRDSGDFAFCWTTYSECDVMNPSDYFEYNNIGLQIKNTSDVYQNIAYFTYNTSLPTIGYGSSAPVNLTSRTFAVMLYKIGSLTRTPSIYSRIGDSGETAFNLFGYGSYFNYFSNTSWSTGYGNTSTIFETLPPTASTIESLQPLKVNQESYIVAYVFKPKFSNFNIDSYIYQYRVGNNGTWLNISQNEEQITINNNNTIYFRILDKSNNEVVDSQTYTITDIGTLNNELNYSIDFSTDYETLENTNIISKYFVDINYLPKSSILKYQYQFVLDGSSLDNNNWNSLDPEVFSYNFETLQNGTLYARILDNEDNVLTTNTFTITEIGKFAINNNNKKNNGFFNKISSSINFGGPISGIINIPINLIKTLSTSIATNTCNNYNLGSLWGTTLVLPCVNIKQHLGDSLYFTIDLIIACVMIYHIIKMFGELYTNLLFMQKNPIQDLGKRGD